MKRSVSLAVVCLGALGCLLFTGCQSGGAANADSTMFTAPPEAVIRENLLLIKLYDAGKNFMAVEKPRVTFKRDTIILTTSGYVESAGGTRIFRYMLPKRFHTADMKGKILWTNMDGSTTAIAVENRNTGEKK